MVRARILQIIILQPELLSEYYKLLPAYQAYLDNLVINFNPAVSLRGPAWCNCLDEDPELLQAAVPPWSFSSQSSSKQRLQAAPLASAGILM